MMALCSATAWASYPDGYYDSLDGKSGLDLKRAVKAVAADHKAISYGTSTWNAFRSTDVMTLNGVDYWWDMYSSRAHQRPRRNEHRAFRGQQLVG